MSNNAEAPVKGDPQKVFAKARSLGYNNNQLAGILGIAPRKIPDIERGHEHLVGVTLVRLAKKLGCPVEELALSADGTPPPLNADPKPPRAESLQALASRVMELPNCQNPAALAVRCGLPVADFQRVLRGAPITPSYAIQAGQVLVSLLEKHGEALEAAHPVAPGPEPEVRANEEVDLESLPDLPTFLRSQDDADRDVQLRELLAKWPEEKVGNRMIRHKRFFVAVRAMEREGDRYCAGHERFEPIDGFGFLQATKDGLASSCRDFHCAEQRRRLARKSAALLAEAETGFAPVVVDARPVATATPPVPEAPAPAPAGAAPLPSTTGVADELRSLGRLLIEQAAAHRNEAERLQTAGNRLHVLANAAASTEASHQAEINRVTEDAEAMVEAFHESMRALRARNSN